MALRAMCDTKYRGPKDRSTQKSRPEGPGLLGSPGRRPGSKQNPRAVLSRNGPKAHFLIAGRRPALTRWPSASSKQIQSGCAREASLLTDLTRLESHSKYAAQSPRIPARYLVDLLRISMKAV